MAETLQKVIQSVLVYILIVTVLRGIVKNPRYGQYFQFFSGVILILILISPVLSLFRSEDGWYRYLEENMLQLDRNRIDSDADRRWKMGCKIKRTISKGNSGADPFFLLQKSRSHCLIYDRTQSKKRPGRFVR